MGGQPQWLVVALVLIGATLASATDCWNIVAKAKTKIQAQRITPKWHECGPESGHDFKTMFEHWKTHHNKTYVDAAQEEKAFARWRHNMVEVAKINHDPDLSWFASGNRYSDQDHDELTRQMAAKQQDLKDLFTGWVTQDHLNTSNTKPGTRRQLLASRVDWNAAGKVTPPKWQGDCGACWAACAASAIESSYLISQGLTVKQVPNFILSEQQLYDCVDGRYNTPDNPCAGGDSGQALIYAADHRVGTIDVYPLQFANGVSSNGYRRVCKEKSVGPGEGVRFGGSGSYVASQNEQALMAAVAVEPVITYYAAGGSFWRYAGGVYRDTNCPNSINHAMLITGYDAKARTWTLKNSWASGWGDDGYLHIPMTGDNNGFCMMQTFLLSPSMVFAEKWAGGSKTVVAAGNKEPTSVRRKSPPPKRRSTLVKPPKKKPPPPPRGARATRKPAPPRPPPRHRVY